MAKKDFIFIIVAIFLLAGIFLIGARGDFFKEKLGLKKQENDQQQASDLSAEEISVTEGIAMPEFISEELEKTYSTSSENILVSAPGPNEIIKGTAPVIKGQARVFENVVSIKIKDGESNNLWLATTTMAEAPDIGQFGPFELKADVSPHSGWAILEVFSDSPKDGSVINLVSFPIYISPSL